MKIQFGELPHRSMDVAPIRILDIAGSHVLRVDACFRTQYSLDELLRGHLQTEHRHGRSGLRRVDRDIERQRRLTDCGTRREDDQVTAMQSGKKLV